MARSGQDLAGALDARRYMVAIAGDPDMTADLKLFAFCLNAFLADQRQRGHRGGFAREQWTTAVGEMMSPPDSLERKTLGPAGLCRRAISSDVPRYEVPRVPSAAIICQSPKARGPEAGKPCGKPACGRSVLDHDPETGEGRWIAYCRNHSHPALDEWRIKRLQQWRDNGCPTPPRNTGGVLARHFPANWDAIYQWADLSWVPLPGRKLATAVKPQLTVLEGGASDGSYRREDLGPEKLRLCGGTAT